ncbi:MULTISPECIES: hypothetical protein [unclassified Duganella]|uniref:hypothetical protein n=1 Tax=unclassified Duganella TaxID=2636909 RepID=UPI0008830058|nr:MULTISPECIES: hypothetical protein [unclassified Duganella]SDF67410.1 hypothetical protein SAMN05216320_101941 [Duganella sp. OV458]SDI61590.1 hypothetical protein SAMN05428973_101474 [Duganella sp. OV510]
MQDNNEPPRFRPVPWSGLETPADVELWIEEHNQALQQHIGKHETGYGVCFTLAEGGDIYLQTTQDGYLVLDVTEDAAWVTPLIMAAARVQEAPPGRMWVLPDDKLVQLMIGLSGLIASSILVVGHNFGLRRRMGAW